MSVKFRHYARIVNLRYQGFTTDEVCERLSISSDQYYVYIGRGRNMLRSCLAEKGVAT